MGKEEASRYEGRICGYVGCSALPDVYVSFVLRSIAPQVKYDTPSWQPSHPDINS